MYSRGTYVVLDAGIVRTDDDDVVVDDDEPPSKNSKLLPKHQNPILPTADIYGGVCARTSQTTLRDILVGVE